MLRAKLSQWAVKYSVMGAAGWACIQTILFFAVEKKSFFQIFADIIGGGTAGAAAGAIFFLVFGAIGFVSGAIYGAFGLFALMVGGALGGMGLGALVHIARNPNQYVFNWPVILIGAVISYVFVKWITARCLHLYDKHGSSILKDALKRLEDT